jgi:hypothetical protein
MSTSLAQTSTANGTTSAQELFALTDEQILQIAPDGHDGTDVLFAEGFAGERSDPMDPLREDLELLAADAGKSARENRATAQRKAAADADRNGEASQAAVKENAGARPGAADNNASAVAPAWLAERMNDPQHGAEARELWQGVQAAHQEVTVAQQEATAARQEAAAFREVFAKPEEARAAAERARAMDEIDRAYFGAAGAAPEQRSASRAQLAAHMLREDPVAFREMVFASLRALEAAGQQGSSPGSAPTGNASVGNASVAPPFRAASATDHAPSSAQSQAPQTLRAASSTLQGARAPQPGTHTADTQQQYETQRAQEAQRQQHARVAAYAAFERAANEDLERGVGGAIERSLQQALPNAARTENGAGLQQRLAAAVRQDVEQALQGDRALGEQVARILSGQRLDETARAQVVRLIGERAQQLVPGATRRVLADWTQTTLAAHGAHGTQAQGPAQPQSAAYSERITPAAARLPRSESSAGPQAAKREPGSRTPQMLPQAIPRSTSRKVDYRRVSDDDILNS